MNLSLRGHDRRPRYIIYIGNRRYTVMSGEEGNSANSPGKSINIDQTLLKAIHGLNNPTIPPPKLEALKGLDRKPLLDFLVRFKRARAKDPSMDIGEWLSGQVIYNIRSRGIEMDNIEAVLQHLDNIEKLQVESRIKHSISRLRTELQWPSEAQSGLEAIRIFILRARGKFWD
eukprot:augustus_masked-scaffold_16-processed-gene-6.7-mRNA-1 protein AED:1.00 eAED:1.00 QI:0/0/0/0/1/1/2/0/172